MIFVTVGTMYPFDRLIKSVDEAVGKSLIAEDIFAQIGHSKYKPKYIRHIVDVDRDTFIGYVKDSSAIIAHAGIGTIAMAMHYNKPLLVMPRLTRYKEHVNNHQLDTARTFAELGYVLAVYSSQDIIAKIRELREFAPQKRAADKKAIIIRINKFLHDLNTVH